MSYQGNCNILGGLYQWNEAMQYSTTAGVQGICPTGWHIPTDAEWQTMEMNLSPGMSPAQAAATGWRGTTQGHQIKTGGTSGFEGLVGFVYLVGGLRRKQSLFFLFINSQDSFGLQQNLEQMHFSIQLQRQFFQQLTGQHHQKQMDFLFAVCETPPHGHYPFNYSNLKPNGAIPNIAPLLLLG